LIRKIAKLDQEVAADIFPLSIPIPKPRTGCFCIQNYSLYRGKQIYGKFCGTYEASFDKPVQFIKLFGEKPELPCWKRLSSFGKTPFRSLYYNMQRGRAGKFLSFLFLFKINGNNNVD
jgi:hypothetical protein